MRSTSNVEKRHSPHEPTTRRGRSALVERLSESAPHSDIRALRIDHTGSTSVPGLAAKPVIDVLLVVRDSGNEETYVPDLEAAGYLLRIRETNWHEYRMFNGPDTEINLHVFSSGCPEMDRILMFRDWLPSNAADRDLYARTKLALALQEWKYVQNYADAKTVVIEEIITRARVQSEIMKPVR